MGIEPAMTQPINVLSKRNNIDDDHFSDPEAIAELKRKRKRPRSQSMHADGFGNTFNNRIAKKIDYMAKKC